MTPSPHSGTFAWDFPAMVEVSLSAADAVLLVFSLEDPESLEQVGHLRDLVSNLRDHNYFGPPSFLVEGLLSTGPTPSSFTSW